MIFIISLLNQEVFNLILYLFHEDYIQTEATCSCPQHRYR